MIRINTRIAGGRLTGVQRYLAEIAQRLPGEVAAVAPSRALDGVQGHLWEQLILPRRTGGDVLWSPSNTGPLATRLQVVTIHDVIALDHPEWFHWKFAAWYRFLLPRLARRVRHIIAVSQFTKARLLATTRVAPDKITVIPNGVDEKFHPRPVAEINVALRRLALPCTRYVLAVGSLAPRKNLARLLAAWGLVQGSVGTEIWLVIAGAPGKPIVFGSGPGLATLPPRVHLAGHVADALLPALYAGAAGFACLSEYEGFGLPPLEAMASGVPVLVSNTTAFPEVVGDAGLYADPLDTGAIADGLRRLLCGAGPAPQLAAKGLARARQFSWERSAAQTWQVLQEAAKA